MVVTWYQNLPRCFAGSIVPGEAGGETVKLPSAQQCPFLAPLPIQWGSSGWACPVQCLRTPLVDASAGPSPPSGGKGVGGAWRRSLRSLKLESHCLQGAWRGSASTRPPRCCLGTHRAGLLVTLCVIPLPAQLQSPPGISMSSASCPVHHQAV